MHASPANSGAAGYQSAGHSAAATIRRTPIAANPLETRTRALAAVRYLRLMRRRRFAFATARRRTGAMPLPRIACVA